MSKYIRSLVLCLTFLVIVLLELGFVVPQMNVITVDGKAIYNIKEYPNQKVKVYITQDGKSYKTLYADDKGNFSVSIDFNHLYMFNMSMDYHGTSKVLIDTKVPSSVDIETSGGNFQYKCDMFELYEGLNTSILNKPILKVRYFEEKKDFDFDKKYTEALTFDLVGFANRVDELKKRRKEVVKTEAEAKSALAKVEKQKKERKVIEFEDENKKPVAENKRGHKSIMDFLNEDEAEEEKVEVVASEEITEEEVSDEGIAVAKEKITASKDEEEEELFLEEELDESEYTSLNVIPKRISIDDDQIVSGPVQPAVKENFEIQRLKIREVQEIKRIEEEGKIRDVVNSYNQTQFAQRNERLGNKKIQTDRLRNLIKTISLAEIYFKRAYYKEHPINHNEVIPSVVIHKNESMWVDNEKIMVRYPDKSIVFRKETYLFGITNYYRGDEKIDEQVYCSDLSDLSKNNYECVI